MELNYILYKNPWNGGIMYYLPHSKLIYANHIVQTDCIHFSAVGRIKSTLNRTNTYAIPPLTADSAYYCNF